MKKLRITVAFVFFAALCLFIVSCNNGKEGDSKSMDSNQEKITYNLIVGKDTVPINTLKKLKNGYYKLDASMNLAYVSAANDDPEDPAVIAPEHDLFKQQNPTMTWAVNFTLDDIGGFYNNVIDAAQFDHKTVDSFRVKFIVYDHAPMIRGVQRHDYRGKVSAALFAMSGGVEYTVTAKPGADIRPRNLGTICPVCP